MRCVDGQDGSELGRVVGSGPGRAELRLSTGEALTVGQAEPGQGILVHRAGARIGELTPRPPTLSGQTFTADVGPHGTWTVAASAFGVRFQITAGERRLATARHPPLSRTLTLDHTGAADPALLLAVVLAARVHRPRDSAFTT
ncbi:hypothetical protein EDD29_3656 [Actinocorallia herbida]|uniref:Uncharacterized protein n=1 Tax=Actinocorallia herbida TaxID=58109 RepID=A0A3N1CXR8_9ACTN|nr:hypothetical protein [Actinocorallia herbida]ROO86093.1 hypothetical protein EDD29_3656 [Actinocorallia herbida]